MKRNCFCCEKSIKSDSDSFQSTPLNATTWETNGNYSSNMFDPIYDDRLQIYICDECLRKKAKFAYFYKTKIKKEYTAICKFSIRLKEDDKARKKFNDIVDKKNKLLKIIKNKRKETLKDDFENN